MTVKLETKSNKDYYKFKQGYFYLKSDNESAEGFSTKEFENLKGEMVKYPGIWAREISGMITNVYITEGEFEGKTFETLNVAFDGGEVVSVGVSTRTAGDVMSKLPSLNFDKEVVFKAYDIKDDNKQGISIQQGGEKVGSHFYDFDAKKNINGAPEFNGDKNDKDDWKIYFKQLEKFLKNYTKENISTRFNHEVVGEDLLADMTEEVDVGDLEKF